MKRPHRWQLEKQRTAKAIRELPKCATEGCQFKAMGVVWGVFDGLCGKCRIEAQRAQREKSHA